MGVVKLQHKRSQQAHGKKNALPKIIFMKIAIIYKILHCVLFSQNNDLIDYLKKSHNIICKDV